MTLDKAALMASARAATGLDDFGRDNFHEPLERLLAALKSEARLNEFGEMRAQMTIEAGLTTRLQVVDFLQRHPDVLEQPVEQPVFIIGLPRTGTTALHHMLNQDPGNRTLRLWEAQDPVPPPETATYHSDPRIAERAEGVALTESFLPGFSAAHLIGAEEPDECYMLLNREFMSVEYSALFHIPSYANWLYANLCARDSYRSHREQLQLLQYRHPGRWVLKAPFHQLGLREILRYYPDAIIVQTHRPPLQFVASGCSFNEILRRSCSDTVDREEIGRDWMTMLRVYTDTFETDRAALEPEHPGQFLDLYHDDFVADPWPAIEAIYAARGSALEPGTRQRMQRWLDANPKGRHGRHEYRLEDYGVSREEVASLFSGYRQRYGLELE